MIFIWVYRSPELTGSVVGGIIANRETRPSRRLEARYRYGTARSTYSGLRLHALF
eukprot:COSAG04_NODE_17493_length_468_cov_0.653117_2_plen_54_part_01